MALKTLDIVLLVISLLASAAIGVYHGVKGLKQTSVDYMLGGRMMNPLPLAMSLTVGTVSAITIMGNAGEMYTNGTQLWLMDVGIAIGLFIVAKFFIPIFYPLKMVSLYHFMEYRFKSKWLRRCTVLLTLGGGYVFIGFLLVPPSAFLQSFTGLSPIYNVVITGIVCSIYSSFGGVKAVVYTDVLQSVIMIAGSLTIVMQGASLVGGLDKAWDIAYHHGRIELFNLNLDPLQRHSFWLVIIQGIFFSMSTYGVNQSQTQRAFSTSTVSDAQKVIYYSIFGILLFRGLVNLSGIVIYATFSDCDPLTAYSKTPLPNYLVVKYYVTQHLTDIPGLSGLFVASVYAAVLSSISTQLNSMTALLWEDFLKDLQIFKNWGEINIMRFQKMLVLMTGGIGILTSLIASNYASFLHVLFQYTGAIWGPMVGLFIVAIYLPWVKSKGATLGFFTAICVSLLLLIGQLNTQPNVQYLPLSRAGCELKASVNTSAVSTNETYIYNSNSSLFSSNMTEVPPTTTSETWAEHSPICDFNFTANANLNRGVGFFGISYCLNYVWGVLTCIIVAVLFTACTSSNTPDEVSRNLISDTSWYWFTNGIRETAAKQVRQRLRRKEARAIAEVKQTHNSESVENAEEAKPIGSTTV